MGISDNPRDCKMEEVTEPIAYSAYCSDKGEVISSYSEPYMMSIWCNGHMSEMLKLDAGVNEIRSECEVRSADGRTQYSTQHGQVDSRETSVVKMRQTGVAKIMENLRKLGEPVYGTIFGLALCLFLIVFAMLVKCIGVKKIMKFLKCTRPCLSRPGHVNNPEIPLRELEPLRQQARYAPVQVFNLSSGNRGEIVPRNERRYRY